MGKSLYKKNTLMLHPIVLPMKPKEIFDGLIVKIFLRVVEYLPLWNVYHEWHKGSVCEV